MTDNSEKKSKLEEKLGFSRKPAWEIWDKKTKDKAFDFAEAYKEFLNFSKTERLAVEKSQEIAKDAGFQEIERFKRKDLSCGISLFATNREKNIILAKIGEKPLSSGIKIIVAHIDSPRIDLKLTPLYEEETLAFFKTQYYGGIKKYQWPTTPLALHGVIVTKDGKKIKVDIGEKDEEPIFIITDLLPHLAKKQMEKKLEEAIEAEELNLLVGSLPLVEEKEAKEKVKLGILKILNEKYGIVEEDLVSAELEAVPAGAAQDLGWDKGLIAGYGHDDRSCSFSALKALLEVEKPEYTSLVFLVDKEETGSASNTGITSLFFYDFVSRLLQLEQKEKVFEQDLRKVLVNSQAISADVTAALDPTFKDVSDPKNAARLGYGIALERYTGAKGKYSTSEASAEYVAKIRQIFDKNKIVWQPATLGKVDIGGGGTVAMFLARFNLEIIDCGVPLLNMHAPFEIASKADLYSTFQAYLAFFGE